MPPGFKPGTRRTSTDAFFGTRNVSSVNSEQGEYPSGNIDSEVRQIATTSADENTRSGHAQVEGEMIRGEANHKKTVTMSEQAGVSSRTALPLSRLQPLPNATTPLLLQTPVERLLLDAITTYARQSEHP
jgi:hypothetical protein